MTTEQWRPIPSATQYEVSDQGRVRRAATGRLRAVHLDSDGYPRLRLYCDDGSARTIRVSQVMAWAFIGLQEPGTYVRHLDGVPRNNVLSNLAYGTPSENSWDSVRHGTHRWSARTHCKHGHPFSGDNVRTVSTRPRVRVCRQCEKDSKQRSLQKKRAS